MIINGWRASRSLCLSAAAMVVVRYLRISVLVDVDVLLTHLTADALLFGHS